MTESIDLGELRRLWENADKGPTYRDGTGILRQPSRDAFNDAARTALPVLLDRLEKLEAVAHAAWNTLQPFQATGSHADAEMEREIRLRRTELRAALVESTAPTGETT